MMFKKTYMSRAMSRAWSMDNPVGDPFGGPAYGEKRDPFSAVSAISMFAAGMAAEGLTAGLLIAGGVMTGLGAITGNKTLSMLGSIAGLGAGVSNFFDKGGFDAFSAAWDKGGVSGVVDQFTGAANYGNPAPVETLTPTPVTSGSAASQMSGIQELNPQSFMADTPSGLINTSSNIQAPATSTWSDITPGAELAGSPATTSSFTPYQSALDNQTLGSSGVGLKPVTTTGAALDASTLGAGKPTTGGVLGFVKDNPVAAMMGAQAISGLASAPAAYEQAKAAQQTADSNTALADQKIEESQYALDKDKARIAAMNQSKPVNVAYSGNTAYKSPSDGRAITAQEYWAEMFNKYFDQTKQAA